MNNCSNSNEEEWTFSDNKQFENALVEFDLNSPNLFENIRAIMPWKTLEQIKNNYEKLVADVAMIENGEIHTPNYGEVKRVKAREHKRRGVPWTDSEHRSFLIGLDKLGKGEWRNISRLYVPTKTPSQVASHGQKYFRRVKNGTPLEKRRCSIHDIRIHNSSIVETSARHPNFHSIITPIPQQQAVLPIHPPQRLLQDNIVTGQQYNINNFSWPAASSNNNYLNNYNNIATTALTSSSNIINNNNNNSDNSSQMMMSNMNNNNDYIGCDPFADYDNLFNQASTTWFPEINFN